MATLEQLADSISTYSDFYKEAYGFRPRHDTSSWTAEQWEQEFNQLARACESNSKELEARESKAKDEVEKRLAKMIELGAKDRTAAIAWLHDAEETNGDNGYLCYILDLPYGYFG